MKNEKLKNVILKYYDITENDFMTCSNAICTEARGIYTRIMKDERYTLTEIAEEFGKTASHASYWNRKVKDSNLTYKHIIFLYSVV